MKKRRIIYIIVAIFILLVCLALAVAHFLTPPAEWPGTDRPESPTIVYENEEYQYRDEIVNILLVGVDQFLPMEEINQGVHDGYADAVLLLSVDTKEREWQLTVIPRDIMTTVFWWEGENLVASSVATQLTWQYVFGDSPKECGDLMKRAVSALLEETPIHRYCTLNYNTVAVINDMIGGVDVEVLEDLTWANPAFVLGETIHLEGENARQYIGIRNTMIEGSNLMRLERQKQYLGAFYKQAKSAVLRNPLLVTDLYQGLQNDMSTDLSLEEVVYLANLLSQSKGDQIDICQIAGQQVKGEVFEEFYPEEKALKERIITSFYEKTEKNK